MLEYGENRNNERQRKRKDIRKNPIFYPQGDEKVTLNLK